MSQDSTVVVGGTGVQWIDQTNKALETINTLHAGAAAPADAECHVNMFWADTSVSPALLKVCTAVGSPSTFVTVGQLTANFGLVPLAGDSSINGNITLAANKKLTMTSGAIDMASVAPASAATLAVTGGNLLQPTGTTGITALGTLQAGAMRMIYFTTAILLTHSSNLLLYGQNITTESGDSAFFVSLGGGVWYLHHYQRGDGTVDMYNQFNESQAANIAAAATTDLASMAGNYAIVTNTSGATVTTALGNGAPSGARRMVTYSITGGSVTITHNATSLICPGAANVSIADGDTAIYISLGSNNWRMAVLQRNSQSARIWTYQDKTATSYTLVASDYGKYLDSSASSATTYTFLSAASAGAGFVVGVRNSNTNSATMTLLPNGSDTIEGVSSMTFGVGSGFVFISDGVSKWMRMDTGISPGSPPAFTTGSQVFSAGGGTLTVPAGVYYIRVSLWGAGGAGGGSAVTTSRAGGAGGAGAFATGIFAVIPGQTYTVTVGSGGVGGTGTGGTGGTSSFGALLTCTGGAGGTAGANGSGGIGGAGGTASGSGTLINGTDGSSAATTNGWGGVGGSAAGGATSGGGAAGTPTSTSATPGATGSGSAAGGNTSGSDGTSVSGTTRESGGGGGARAGGGTGANGGGNGASPGAGGGSAQGSPTSSAASGGNGGDGKCIVEW